MSRFRAAPLDLIRALAEGTIAFLAEESRQPFPREILRRFIIDGWIFFEGWYEVIPQFVHLICTALSFVRWALEVHVV